MMAEDLDLDACRRSISRHYESENSQSTTVDSLQMRSIRVFPLGFLVDFASSSPSCRDVSVLSAVSPIKPKCSSSSGKAQIVALAQEKQEGGVGTETNEVVARIKTFDGMDLSGNQEPRLPFIKLNSSSRGSSVKEAQMLSAPRHLNQGLIASSSGVPFDDKNEIKNLVERKEAIPLDGKKDRNEEIELSEGIPKMLKMQGNSEGMKRLLKVEVIDETALIETNFASKVVNGRGKKKGSVGIPKHPRENVTRQELDGKEEKWARREGKSPHRLVGNNGKENNMCDSTRAENDCLNEGTAKKAHSYSRGDMEALRFVNLEAQQKKWFDVYGGLVPTVAKEYDGLINYKAHKHISLDFNPRYHFVKKATPALLGVEAARRKRNLQKVFVH